MRRSARFSTDHPIRLLRFPVKMSRRPSRPLVVVALAATAVVATGCVSGQTGTPSNVSDHAATLTAQGSAGGKPATYWFEYGTSTSYGTSTPHRDGGSGSDQRNVAERVTGLSPDTTLPLPRLCLEPGRFRLRQGRDVPHGLARAVARIPGDDGLQRA